MTSINKRKKDLLYYLRMIVRTISTNRTSLYVIQQHSNQTIANSGKAQLAKK